VDTQPHSYRCVRRH